MSKPLFEIENLCVEIEGKEVIKDFSLTINRGEVHALMGRNGSGKSTLSCALMGHPRYNVKNGSVKLDGEEITGLSPDERAKRKLFLAFQYPVAIPGVTVANFLRTSLRAVLGSEIAAKEIRKRIKEESKKLGISDEFLVRSLNDGFSGGEKKKLETLQLRLLEPKVAILDETDSGLDIDALRTVSEKINETRNENRAILVITHYQRMLNYIQPDFVHVLMNQKIETSGGPELALKLEESGYDWIPQQGASAQQ